MRHVHGEWPLGVWMENFEQYEYPGNSDTYSESGFEKCAYRAPAGHLVVVIVYNPEIKAFNFSSVAATEGTHGNAARAACSL